MVRLLVLGLVLVYCCEVFGFSGWFVVGLAVSAGFVVIIVWYFWLDCSLCWIDLLSLLF